MTKKRYILLSVAALLLAAIGTLLTSCDRSGDDPVSSGQQQPDNTGGGSNDNADGNALRIVAAKQPFTDETGTRADTDFGGGTYATTFETGDEIGVIAVKDGAVLDDCNNLPFTYNSAEGSWEGDDIFYIDGATYIAYSPFRATEMDGKTSAQQILDAFTVATDQSTAVKFAANDLMIDDGGTADKAAKTLTFSFSHRMAMMEVPAACGKTHARTTDGWVYPLKGGTLSWSSVKVNDVSIRFFKNAAEGANTPYRYLLKPGTFIKLSFPHMLRGRDGMGINITYATNNNTFVAGQRRRIFPTKTRDIVVGDYYYDDGSFFPSDYQVQYLIPYNKDEGCVGIVFKVGVGNKDAAHYYVESGLIGEVHGYAIALEDANEGNVCKWGNRSIRVYNSDTYLGYYATDVAKKMFDFSVSGYTACWHSVNYPVTAPSNSSGWYFAYTGHMTDIVLNKSVIETSLSKVGGTGFSGFYWTAYDTSNVRAYCMDVATTNYIDEMKSTSHSVRSVVTF